MGLERMIQAGVFPGHALSSKWFFSSYVLIGQSCQNRNHIDSTLTWFPLLPTYRRSGGHHWFCVFWEAVSSLEDLVLCRSLPFVWQGFFHRLANKHWEIGRKLSEVLQMSGLSCLLVVLCRNQLHEGIWEPNEPPRKNLSQSSVKKSPITVSVISNLCFLCVSYTCCCHSLGSLVTSFWVTSHSHLGK